MSANPGRSNWRLLGGLYLAGLVISLLAAVLESSPGYMDADYYYAGGRLLAGGQGASEPYLWNYLNHPQGLPATSFAYWMPMTSLVAAAGLLLFPTAGFWGARLGAILLAAAVPVVTALLAGRSTNHPAAVRQAGILALFPGFYLAYQTTTDAFPIYMVTGGLFFSMVFENSSRAFRPASVVLRALFLGLLAGVFHLTRADGMIWLGGALLAVWFWQPAGFSNKAWYLILRTVAVVSGYALVMAPWFIRNLAVWGKFLPPGGARAVWITEYEQTMLYPAVQLTREHWLAAGWASHLQDRLTALGLNMQTVIAVQGGIILLPFIVAGLWKHRRQFAVRLGVLMWLLTAGLMTVFFPFAGGNGGFFHSGAALQPLLWAVVPTGVEQLMLGYARWRRVSQPMLMVRFMSAVIVAMAVLLTALVYFQRVAGSETESLAWNASRNHYQAVEQTLVSFGAGENEPVLVNNPPGYWLVSGRPAVVIPYGDETMLLNAARDFGVRYLVLETINPGQLSDLYHRRISLPELEFLTAVESTQLYRINTHAGGR